MRRRTLGISLTLIVILLAIAALLVVATIASEVLGRAVLGARDGSGDDDK